MWQIHGKTSFCGDDRNQYACWRLCRVFFPQSEGSYIFLHLVSTTVPHTPSAFPSIHPKVRSFPVCFPGHDTYRETSCTQIGQISQICQIASTDLLDQMS